MKARVLRYSVSITPGHEKVKEEYTTKKGKIKHRKVLKNFLLVSHGDLELAIEGEHELRIGDVLQVGGVEYIIVSTKIITGITTLRSVTMAKKCDNYKETFSTNGTTPFQYVDVLFKARLVGESASACNVFDKF